MGIVSFFHTFYPTGDIRGYVRLVHQTKKYFDASEGYFVTFLVRPCDTTFLTPVCRGDIFWWPVCTDVSQSATITFVGDPIKN